MPRTSKDGFERTVQFWMIADCAYTDPLRHLSARRLSLPYQQHLDVSSSTPRLVGHLLNAL
jgi:hypothetical protein